MKHFDVKIVNGRLATTAGVFDVDIGIADGIINSIGAWGDLPDAGEVIDAKGKVVLPGGIDTHCHGGDPGFEEMGVNFANASMAGALGGVTTIVDMPMQIPMTKDAESLEAKLQSISRKAHVDFALWATCDEDNAQSVLDLKESGIVGFKLVMQRSVEGFMPYHHDGVIYEALKNLTETDLVATIHAENQDIIIYLEEKLKAAGRKDPRAFLDTHPVITELEAIQRILLIAGQVGARINIAHCSIADGIDLVEGSKQAGQPVTVETCIHYLTTDNSIFDKRGAFAKLAPALRDQNNIERMWDKLREGKIDCVASDHVPYPYDFKDKDIWECAAGAGGIQTLFPLLVYEGITKKRIELPQLVKVMSEGPAKVCGLYPKKGCAMVGSDADFAIFDLRSEREVVVEEQIGLDWSLHEGRKVVYPDIVLLRGKKIVEKGEIVGEAGYGTFTTPQH